MGVQAGVTYQIAVDGYDGASGTIGLSTEILTDNDAFANRAALSGTDILVHDDNFSATTEPDEPEHADNPGGGSIWWSWTAPHSGVAELSTYGSNFDTLLAIYTGDELNALSAQASDPGFDGFGSSEVTFLAKEGTTYQIAVDGADNARGFIELSLTLAPANDAFESPTKLSGSFTSIAASSLNAARQTGEPDHGGNEGGASLWWSWEAPVSGEAVIDTYGSGFDTLLAVYQGSSLTALNLVAQNDDEEALNALTSAVRINVIEGREYLIAVDGFAGVQGDIVLTLRIDNNDFAQAARLSGSSIRVSDHSSGADSETGEPMHAAVPGGASLWWTWVAPVSGTVKIDTLGSDFDTTLGVYTGASVDALAEVASNDNGSTTGPSELSFAAVRGVAYRIAVDGYNGDFGAVSLALRVVHDDFSDAARIFGSRAILTDSNAGATAETNEPMHGDAPIGASLWWAWTAPAAGTTAISTKGSDFDTTLAVYTGTDLASLTLIAENDDARSDLSSSVSFLAAPGEIYLIAVDGFEGDQGSIRLELTRGPPNDDFLYRAPLTGFVNNVTGSNIDASSEASEPIHGGAVSAGGRSVWWTYTAPIDGSLQITTDGSDFDTLLGVYAGNTLADLVSIAQNDDNGTGRQSSVNFDAVAGQTYQIVVDGAESAQGTILLTATMIPEMNTPPAVFLPFPANGSTFDGPTPLTLQANASDSDGIVVSVDFYRDETLLGSVTEPPFAWTTDELAPGNHTFRVEATDNLGGAAASTTSSIVVNPAYEHSGNWNLVFPFFPASQVESVATAAGAHSEIDADETVAVHENKIYYAVSEDGTAFPSKLLQFNPGDNSVRTVLQNIEGSRFTSVRELNGELYAADSFGWLSRRTGASFDYLRPPYDSEGDYITAMAELNATLYLGTDQGRVFARTPAGEFQLRHTLPAAITTMTQWQGRLYIADREEDDYSSRIVSTGDGFTWEESAVFNSFAFAGMVATPDRLYVASVESPWSASLAIWSSTDGSDWERIFFTEDHGRDLQGRPHYSPQTQRVYYLSEWTGGVSLFVFHQGKFEARVPMPYGYTSLIELDGRLYALGADAAATGYSSPHRIDRLGEYYSNVPGNARPTVVIAAPADGIRLPEGANLTVAVDASDVDGTVQRVEFLIDDLPAGDDLEAPFELELVAPALGELQIRARAWDDDGAIGISQTIRATVTPDNDDFANRITLSGNEAIGSGVNAFASREPDEPNHADSPGGRSVWWSWTAPFTGQAVATTEDSDFDTLLAVYSGSSLASLTPLAGNDDDGENLTSLVVFPVVAGATYSLAVDGYNGDVGAISLLIQRQASNDPFAESIPLAGSSVNTAGANVGATKAAGEPDHASNAGGHSVWWHWTAPSDGNVTLDTRGSQIDTLLAVYTGSGIGNLTLVAENDQDPDGGDASILSFNATSGVTYRIAVDGYLGDQGAIALNLTLNSLNDAPSVQILSPANDSVFAPLSEIAVSAQADDPDGFIEQVYFFLGPDLYVIDDTPPYTASFAGLEGGSYRISAVAKDNLGVFSSFHRISVRLGPANDDFAERLALQAADGTLTGSSLGASRQPGEPDHNDSPDGASVWYQWTAPQNLRATFTLENSGFDTLLAVYTGSDVASLTPIASDDDSGGDLTSAVTFNANAGVDYLIAVAGYDGDSGLVQMKWTTVAATSEPPKIIQHPVSRAFGNGTTAAFSVMATSTLKLSYQWTRNRVAIPGATAATLTIANVAAAHVGVYRAVVTDERGASVISEPATLELGAMADIVSRNKFRDAAPSQAITLQNRPPKKDAIIPVTSGALGVQVFSNFDSGAERGEPMHAGQAAGSSRWFTLKPDDAGLMVLDTIGSSIDTVLAVYQGSGLANLRLVKSDDNGAPDGIRSRLSFAAEAGAEYQIVVDGVAGQQGTINLNWILLVPFDILPPTVAGNQIQIRIQAKPNVKYTTQVSSNLKNWSDFSTDQSATGEIVVTDTIPTGAATRLYRVVIKP